MLPFGRQEFLEVFGRYNIAVWPAQLLLYAVALVIVALILRRERRSVVVALLATLWLWTGVVYHLLFFSEINPAARYFGIAFIAQAVLLLATDRRQTASGEWGTPIARSTGKVLIAYALVGYPLIGSLAGQTYPTVVTLGLPCPTTIFTIGVLLIALPAIGVAPGDPDPLGDHWDLRGDRSFDPAGLRSDRRGIGRSSASSDTAVSG